jgi:protein-S-isoprenylcysteine O-methyltransferase Ste14
MASRVFVWCGGALFVASLTFCVYIYAIRWNSSIATPVALNAAAIDLALITLFAAHHSVFARDAVKTRLARAVPADLLRSVYVWIASLLLIAVLVLWQPVGGELYASSGAMVWLHATIQIAGVWVIARAVATIDPLELAGIRENARRPQSLQVAGPYRIVRHPLYLGWLMATFGAARMTGDRLTFAVATSLYLFVAVPWEERSLVRTFGDEYRRYQRAVRWRIVPFIY